MQLNGFGAASGLVSHNNQIYLVSDDSDYLFQYSVKEKEMQQREKFMKFINRNKTNDEDESSDNTNE